MTIPSPDHESNGEYSNGGKLVPTAATRSRRPQDVRKR